MAKSSLRNTYTYHPPVGTQQARYVQIREAAEAFAQLITDLTPPSREQSLALTDVQRACQMANAAIAINETVDSPINQTAAEPVVATQEPI